MGQNNINFNIIMPVYNAEKYIQKSIESVLLQTYKNWKLIVLDDASTDNTKNNILKFKGHNIILRTNKERLGTLRNTYTGIKELTDRDSIIIHIDGDDWFNNENVFERIKDVYNKNDIWVTYGNYKTISGRPSICRPISSNLNFRKSIIFGGWRFSQPRTYKRKLFDYINVNDLMRVPGVFYEAAADVALFLPILEMSGPDRIKFIEDINYIYNDINPISNHNCKLNVQAKCALSIYHSNPYKRLNNI